MTTDLATVDSKRRTAVLFAAPADPWPVIGAWAKRHGFLPREPQTGSVKLFQKGSGLWTAPMMAQFTVHGPTVQLQAWVRVPFFARLFALFLLPDEIRIDSGGIKAALPRRIARSAVNDLLAQVGAPLIS